jgi:hypothetical protein
MLQIYSNIINRTMNDWPKDITKASIQSYLLNFYGSSKAPKHQALFGVGDRCNKTSIQESKLLSFPQSVVSTVMKGFASVETTNRGILVWHSLGSGKTASATAVMDAFWDTDKTIVFSTSVEAINNNPPSAFHMYAQKFFPRFQNKTTNQIAKEFEKRKIKFLTFAQLAHYLMIANPLKSVKKPDDIERHKNLLNNAVIIIDEVHNIFKPLPNQKLENNAVKTFLTDYNNPYTTNLKIVILTATPGDTPDDVVQLLNMIRDKNAKPIVRPDVNDKTSLQLFEDSISGLISYFDMSKDYTRFPKVIEERPVKSPLSPKQFIRYTESYNKEPTNIRNANTLLKENQIAKYYKHARRYSNMLYDLDKDMMVDEFSSKLPSLINSVEKYPNEKHYIYSSFYENRGFGGHGILAIAKTFESQLNYSKLTEDLANKMISNINSVEKKPRYLLAISAELGDNREKLRTLLKAFNIKENARGEYVQLFLASQGYNEGVDLKHIRHVHIFEPLLTFAADKQTIGRAARYCSHADLQISKGEWTVKVHRYLSEMPDDMSVFNINYFNYRLEYLKDEMAKLQKTADDLKGLKGFKEKKDAINKEISGYKQMLKDIEKKHRELEKMNLKNVEMIDQKISDEAISRAKEMMIIYDIMKKQAIDYLLFKDYLEQATF